LNYHNFIHQSLGEFSVAKETYVKSNSGWFSCRSACYLAAGKPVVTQDTGWSRYIPPGAGLIPFTTAEEAVEGLRQILNEPYRHAKAAAQVAREYFDSSKVLESLLWVVLGSNT
jgi:glycosyltransferase involved in cell wall biosynthesis